MNKPNPKASSAQIEQDRNAATQQETTIVPTTAPEQAPVVVNEDKALEDTTETKETGNEAPSASQEPIQSTQTIETPSVAKVTVNPVSAPVVKAPNASTVAKVVVEETITPAKGNTLKDKLANILKNVPTTYQGDIARIIAYTEAMAPGKAITNKEGAKQQVALYKAIQNIINRQEQYFTPLFTALLFIFKEESKATLGDRYRLRFMESVELADGDRKAFMCLTHLLFATAEPNSRATILKTINMTRALENGLVAEGRDRVLHYYDM